MCRFNVQIIHLDSIKLLCLLYGTYEVYPIYTMKQTSSKVCKQASMNACKHEANMMQT